MSVIVIIPDDHHLNHRVVSICQAFGDVVRVIKNSESQNISEPYPDVLLNFLAEKIVKVSKMPSTKCINFHPADPKYPGRGSGSYALYNNEKTCGAVVHYMEKVVDSGDIIAYASTPIEVWDTCETVFAKSEQLCLDLFSDILGNYMIKGTLPKPLKMKWNGKAKTRLDFIQWIMMKPEDDDFDKKISATYHSKFPGPYVKVNGYTFGLVKNEENIQKIMAWRKKKA